MKKLTLFILIAIFSLSISTSFVSADDPTSTPIFTSAPAPSNTSAPAPSNTSAPAPSNTSAPAPSNTQVPVVKNEPTKAPAPTTNLNKVVKITRTIPPTLDPEEAKLLAVTATEDEISPSNSPTPTPMVESSVTSKAFKFLPFLTLTALIMFGAFGYNNYKKTGKFLPEDLQAKLKNLLPKRRSSSGGGLRKL